MFKVLYQEFRRYLTSFIRLIYPSFCIFCNSPLGLDEDYSCVPCIDRLPVLREPLCPKCSMELAPYATNQRCTSCSNAKTYYDRGRACFRYDDQMKSLFQHIKFSKKSWHLNVFKQVSLSEHLPQPLSEYDMIVPVPMDNHRLHEREFNQSEIIARLLARGSKAKICRALKKAKRTLPQSSLHKMERWRNLEGVFKVRSDFDLNQKKILIIDDIVTTSATINECARILKARGAKRVDFFSIARTIQWLN